MTIVFGLSKIIRELKNDEKPERGEVLRRVRPPAKNLLDFPSARRYALRLKEKTEAIESKLTVHDVALNKYVVVPVHWHATLQDDAKPLLDWLVTGNELPQPAIEAQMQDFLREQARERGAVDLGQWLHNERDVLARGLSARLLERSLLATCELKTDELKAGSIAIPPFTIEEHAGKSRRKVPLALDLTVHPASTAHESAPKGPAAWRTVFEKAAREHLLDAETLDSYYRDADQMVARLETRLNQAATDKGWRLSRCSLTPQPLPASAQLSDTFKESWKSVDGKAFAFNVRVAIEIARGGIGKYDANGWKDLRQWVHENLHGCFDEVFFEHDKENLSPDNFPDVREKLRKRLQARAALIGLQIKMLFPDPDIVEWDFLTDRAYAVPARSYMTENVALTVNFDMTVTGRFKTLGAAFKVAKHDESLIALIVREASGAAEALMKEVDPADYFSGFSEAPGGASKDNPMPTKGYVKDRLQRAVTTALLQKLSFRVSDVSVVRRDPDVIAQAQMMAGLPAVEFKLVVMPAGRTSPQYAIPVTVLVQYERPAAKALPELMSHKLRPEELQPEIEANLVQALEGRPQQELTAQDTQSRQVLCAEVGKFVNRKIRSRGLTLAIISIRPGLSKAMAILAAAAEELPLRLVEEQTADIAKDFGEQGEKRGRLHQAATNAIPLDRPMHRDDQAALVAQLEKDREDTARKVTDIGKALGRLIAPPDSTTGPEAGMPKQADQEMNDSHESVIEMPK